MSKLLTALFVFIMYLTVSGQQGVAFYEVTLERALEIAKKKNKSVFVDAYAPWCIPCKKMNKYFRDPILGEVFNQNYINVKLNVDLPENAKSKAKYDIVFLPTIMVLDSGGKVRYKVDKFLDKEDLLQIATLTADPNVYYASEATRVSSSPIHQDKNAVSRNPVKKEDVTLQAGEKILAVLDINNSVLPPEVLYQEAYLRLEKMDGSYRTMVKQYLEGQDDWTTEKNIKFIFDFLDGSNPKAVDFFFKNRPLFEHYFTADDIDKSAAFVLYNRLYQAVPRPDKKEVIALFTYLNYTNPEAKANQYLSTRDQKTEDNY